MGVLFVAVCLPEVRTMRLQTSALEPSSSSALLSARRIAFLRLAAAACARRTYTNKHSTQHHNHPQPATHRRLEILRRDTYYPPVLQT
jgi:hypothetical protein